MTPDPDEKFVGIQVSPISFIDEGVDTVLDTLKDRVGVNVLMLGTVSWLGLKTGRSIAHALDGWPDHGVPEGPDEFLNMIKVVQELEDANSAAGPTLVHCSAGVGRTGVFLLVSVILDKLRQSIIPDFTAVLQELRKQRMLLVQMPQQFVFCFEAAIAALKSDDWRYYKQ